MNRTMNEYLKIDPWKIVEERFDAARMKSSESLFALGNGVMGGRANFEERYTGPTLQGNYIGGVYYPDKTRVGWWKNGYPEYFAKVLNAAFWIGVDISIDGETLDAAQVEVLDFYRETDMRRSVLTRRMRVRMRSGAEVAVEAVRFLSLARRELGVVSYSVTPLDRAAEIVFSPHIDADVRNADANYDEKFWEEVATEEDAVRSRTKKSGFEAAWAQAVTLEGAEFRCETTPERVRHTAAVRRGPGERATLYKYVGICSSLNHAPDDLVAAARAVAADGRAAGFEALLHEQGGGVGRAVAPLRHPHRGRRGGPAGHPLLHLHAAADLHGRRHAPEHRPEGFYGREVRRRDLLGHGGLLPAVLHDDGRPRGGPRAARLPL